MRNLLVRSPAYSLELRREVFATQRNPLAGAEELLGGGIILSRFTEEEVRKTASMDSECFDKCVPDHVDVVRAELASVKRWPDAHEHLGLVEHMLGDRA